MSKRNDSQSKKSRPKMRANKTGSGRGADEGQRHRIPAGEFKAVCLKLMDRVKEKGAEYVVTKRGRPVAKLVPIKDEDLRPFVGRSRGVITVCRGDLLAPVGEDLGGRC